MRRFLAHLGRRRRALGLCLVVSATAGSWGPAPPERSPGGVAALLSGAVGRRVSPEDVLWEPERDPLTEAILGRRVLFLSRPEGDAHAPRDLQRAAVRVSAEGHLIAVRTARRLTNTPLADEAGLARLGELASYATVSPDRIEGLTLLDLGGGPRLARPWGIGGRIAEGIASYLEFGSFVAPLRTHVAIGSRSRRLRSAIEDGRVQVELDEPEGRFTLDAGRASIIAAEGLPATVSLGRAGHGDRPVLAWLARLLGVGPSSPVLRGLHGTRVLFSDAFPARGRGEKANLSDSEAFTPIDIEWLPGRGNADKASYFEVASFRPEPGRASRDVHLVALDLRYLAMHLVAGYERPQPLPFGATGTIPERLRPDVVAAFPVASRAEGGWVADGRVALPIRDESATWMVTRFGHTFFAKGSLDPIALSDATSLLQSDSPLAPSDAAGDVANERSALCATRDRRVVYAWSQSSTPGAFAAALQRAGCVRGVRLAEGPDPSGFSFLRLGEAGVAHTRLLHPAMTLRPDRLVSGSEDDFIYVTLRAKAEGSGDLAWTPSPGVQAAPTSVPAVLEGSRRMGELSVKVFRFEAGRFDWVLRAGSEEPSAALGQPKKLALGPELVRRSIASIGLGHTTEALRSGMVFEGRPSLDLRRGQATLVLRAGEAPRILTPLEAFRLEGTDDAVHLPLLADEGQLIRSGSDQGPMRHRGALCVTGGGAILVALARHDSSDPLGSVLIDAGCSRVVSLDRGSRHAAFVHRTFADQAARDAYPVSVLHAVSRPMVPPVDLL